MKISVIFNIILAVIIAVICLAKHVTIVNSLPAETPAVAPVDATGDSSWLWTDFSHMDTVFFTDKWTAKKPWVYFEAVLTYHKNGIEALRVQSEPSMSLEEDGTRKIDQTLSYKSPNGYEIAYSYQKITYKQFLEGIAAPRVFSKYDGWECRVNHAYTKNPSSCPEPSPKTHVYNHQVKED